MCTVAVSQGKTGCLEEPWKVAWANLNLGLRMGEGVQRIKLGLPGARKFQPA